MSTRRLAEEDIFVLERATAAGPLFVFGQRLDDRSVIYASPSVERLLGLSVDEVKSRPGLEFLMTRSSRRRFEGLLERTSGGDLQELHGEFEFSLAAGTRWFSISARLDERDGIKSLLGFAVDATDRVRSMEEAKESEARYQAIFTGVPSGIFRCSSDGEIIESNPALVRIFGYDSAEELKAHVPDLGSIYVDPADRARFIREVTDRGSVQDFETQIRQRDRKVIDVSMNVSAVRDESGQVVAFEGTLIDITERIQAVADARRARGEADLSNQAKSVFLSRMSHELRTPLNSVIGFAQLLELRDLGPQDQESVRHILKGGRHLLDLINEVLDIARVEAGRLSLSLEPVEVFGAIAETVDLIQPIARSRSVSVTFNPDPGNNLYVLADRQRVKQILLNLLSNGIKYNHSGGAMGILARIAGDMVSVDVADTGPGIGADLLDRLFTPFERLGADMGDEQGTGLGLALSKHLAEAMGGSIVVDSTLGSGSTFSLCLSHVEAPTAEEARALVPRNSPHPIGAKTVIYIEDNLANLTLVRQILELRPEVTIESAMQGRVGLLLARDLAPDLILLDVNLPDMQGGDVLRELKLDPLTAGIPVLMVSADASPGQIDRLLSAGAIGYLTKPLNVVEFLETIDSVLVA
jgi:PAS domain S-box-containing protein